MEDTLFRFIIRYSLRQQFVIVMLTAVSFPFLYMSLDLPKIIINEAISGTNFPQQYFGFEFDQIPYLLVLSVIFLTLVLVNAAFKYFIEIYRGKTGERMLRRLRFQLYDRILRFPLPHFRRIHQDELIPMITEEVEPVGGFVGAAISVPALYGGTLVVILTFMFVQDYVLGLAAIALYPIQAICIPVLQKKLLDYDRHRIQEVRRLASVIGESVRGVADVHANDASHFLRASISDRLGQIYGIRYNIYQRKFLIKFLNTLLSHLTPFFFFAIGGYLVIKGGLTLGALLAVLAAYKDLETPWNELLKYYQELSAVRMKYEQVVRNFAPPSLIPEPPLKTEMDAYAGPLGELVADTLTLIDENEIRIVDGVSFRIDQGQHIAVIGPEMSGKAELGMLLGGLISASSGRLSLGGRQLSQFPRGVLGRRLGYVGSDPFLFSGTVADNILLGLKHEPVGPGASAFDSQTIRDQHLQEALISGNSPFDPRSDWIDLEAAGVANREDLAARCVEVLSCVNMDSDLYEIGLRSIVAVDREDDTAKRLLEARQEVARELERRQMSALVERFDPDTFNQSASIGENILFGASADDLFNPKLLGQNPYMRDVLHKCNLTEPAMNISVQVAELMVELFSDIDPGSELYTRFNFISADSLSDFKDLVNVAKNKGVSRLNEAQKRELLSLFFRIVPTRHRLVTMDEQLISRILHARREFSQGLPPIYRNKIEFFDAHTFNLSASLQDNILFGKVVYGQPHASDRVGEVIRDVINSLGLRSLILRFGLDCQVGTGGVLLNPVQRQKVMIARQILKRPDTLILNDCFGAFDSASQETVITQIREECRNQRIIAVLSQSELARLFPSTLVMSKGRIAPDAQELNAVAE